MFPNAMNNRWSNTGLGLLPGCLLFVAVLRCEAQNLIPNHSFEEADTCHYGLSFIYPEDGPLHWFSAYLHADHLQSCLSYGSANGLPMNTFTYQEPMEGESCIGLFSYYQNGSEEQREWIMVQLQEPLVIGQTYYASFYANAAFGGNAQYPTIWLASNNIGMLFTTQNRQWQFGDAYPPALNIAHIRRPEILVDTVGWTLVSGSFVADSVYQYLMIGNFFNNAQTDTLHFADPGSVFPWYPRGYTLIDNVCVSSNPNGCDLEHGVGSVFTKPVLVYPNPAQGQVRINEARGSTVRIRDAVGRAVWQGSITQDVWLLEVAAWARGTYILTVDNGEVRKTFKFVLTE